MWVRIEDRKPNRWGAHYVFGSTKEPFTAFWHGTEIEFADQDGEKLIPIYNSITHWFDFSFVKNPV